VTRGKSWLGIGLEGGWGIPHTHTHVIMSKRKHLGHEAIRQFYGLLGGRKHLKRIIRRSREGCYDVGFVIIFIATIDGAIFPLKTSKNK
jgi:hypothetical protein